MHNLWMNSKMIARYKKHVMLNAIKQTKWQKVLTFKAWRAAIADGWLTKVANATTCK